MVYRLDDNKLLPVEDVWGCMPRHEMLRVSEVFVFDFGSEMYIWQGRQVSLEKRKSVLRLARQLWEEGYDYSECNINPLSPLQSK